MKMKIKKETTKTIVIVVLIILLLGSLAAFLIIPKYNNKVYNKGFVEGQIDVIVTQMQTGNIFIINNNTIESYPINVICDARG